MHLDSDRCDPSASVLEQDVKSDYPELRAHLPLMPPPHLTVVMGELRAVRVRDADFSQGTARNDEVGGDAQRCEVHKQPQTIAARFSVLSFLVERSFWRPAANLPLSSGYELGLGTRFDRRPRLSDAQPLPDIWRLVPDERVNKDVAV